MSSFFWYFLSDTFPSLSIWRINDGNFLIQGPQGESRRAPSSQFGGVSSTSPSSSSGVDHISCRVSSSISCHHPQYQTVHRAALTSMTRPFGCLPVGTQTGVGCIPTKTLLYRVLVELSLLFHLSVDILLQFLFVCSYSLVHDMVNAELFRK